MKASITEDKKATEFLANERTFLAWIRTSISVVSFGFVVAKFSVWLREIATQIQGPGAPIRGNGISMRLGVGMMAFGGALAILAAWHYHMVNLAIERGEVRANRGLVVIVSVAVALLAALMIAFVLLTVEHL
jgi:putative membrane protein